MRAIIELTGETGAGKTTLANALGEELAPASLLFIDASPDQRLTQMLAPQSPQLTLGQLFSRRNGVTGSREAVDWVFHDMIVPTGEENELIAVGALPEEIGIAEREKLKYGLTRLVAGYDYVVVDGFHPVLRRVLPEENLRTLIVLTPAQMNRWMPPAADETHRTPSVILNQYGGEPFSPSLEEAITSGQVQLIGKLPRYASPEECVRKLSDDFRNCLFRLNIPLNFSPS
jgi:energy-coupling factor transporter ATP-binding protein EcfA2